MNNPRLEVAQADSQFIIAAQDLILRVAQAYFDILLAEVNLEVADAQLKAIRVQLEQAKRNFEVGTATVDTHEAQARYDFIPLRKLPRRMIWKYANDRCNRLSAAYLITFAVLHQGILLTC